MNHPGILRVLTMVALGALTAGCQNDPPPSAPAPDPGRCRYFVLDTGDRIFLLDKPQGASMNQIPSSEGLAAAPLVEPDFSGPLPERFDLRTEILHGCLQVRNQGECGWCVGHAAGAALDALYCAEGCPSPRVSMPHLWATGHDGEIADCGTGWYVSNGLDAVSTTPLVHESEWPFANGSRAMNGTRPSELMGRYRATGYTAIPESEDRLEIMKRVLASGRMLVVSSGLCFNYGWVNGRTDIDDPPNNCAQSGAEYDGYHAYTIVGYDDQTMRFIALNSWGNRWGIGGYMHLTYAFAENELLDVAYLNNVDPATASCMPSEVSDRCASISDCAACTTTTGCLFCDGQCVPSDESGTSPASGECQSMIAGESRECPLADDPCMSHSECGSCAEDPRCSWCGDDVSGGCFSWPARWSMCAGLRVATESAMCNDVTGVCEAARGCSECLNLEGCGYCTGPSGSIHSDTDGRLCFGGSDRHADRASCKEGWTQEVAICPPPNDPSDMDAGIGNEIEGGVGPEAGICGTSGGTCLLHSDCCMGLSCIAEICRDPSECGIYSVPCTNGNQCCGGLSCLSEVFGGSTVCCVGYTGGGCESDAHCCGEMACVAGQCTKRQAGQSCANDNDCGGVLQCRSGTCAP